MKYLIALFFLLSLSLCTQAQTMLQYHQYCGEISKSFDDVVGGEKYLTPLDKNVYFRMLSNGGNRVIYMNLITKSPAGTAANGVRVDLERGYVIERNVPTNVYQDADGKYVHYAEIKLSKQEIKMLKMYNVVGFSLGNYNQAVDNFIQLKAYIMCLTE